MASAKSTIDHDEIRQWVEERGGHPARVKGTEILRIDYPGFSGEESLQRVSWDEWLDAFDENKLAFLFQDEDDSRFSKLIERKRATKTKKRSAAVSAASAKRPAQRRTAKTDGRDARPARAGRPHSKKTAASTKKRAASTKSTKKPAVSAAAKRTTNHDLIRRWVESRGGWPATVKATKSRGDSAGLLRIELERISWNDFFKKFDREKLAFLYQDKPRSRFSKLVRK